jgi:hypothetical protein
LLGRTYEGLSLETTFAPFHRFCIKFLVPPHPLLVLVQFPLCRDGCCFGLFDSRSGGGQFISGKIDQIHKMDCINEMTSIGVFRQGCLHTKKRRQAKQKLLMIFSPCFPILRIVAV